MRCGTKRRMVCTTLVLVLTNTLYFFIFAEPLKTELSLIPQWKTSLAEQSAAGFPSGAALSYSAGQRAGYFYPDGTIAAVIDGKPPISDTAYVYAQASDKSLRKPDGTVIAALDASAPFYADGRLFSAEADGTGLSAYDERGKKLWTYLFPCQISTFSARKNLIVAGTVDGWLEGVSTDGSGVFSFAPGGSRLGVILGLDVSRSGTWVAALCGIDKQRLVVLGKGGSDYRIVSHRYLDSSFRGPVRVVILDDEKHVVYCGNDGVAVRSVDGKVDAVLPVEADDFTVSLDTASGIAYLVATHETKRELVVFRLPATVLGRIDLPDSTSFIRLELPSMYIGAADWLAAVRFEEK